MSAQLLRVTQPQQCCHHHPAAAQCGTEDLILLVHTPATCLPGKQHLTRLSLFHTCILQNARSSRLGFRLMQLSLAVALQQHMLPGLTIKPTAYDPEFEPADVELLDSLGFTVPACEPNHMVTAPTLLYMPCCPRQLYSDVLVSAQQGSCHSLCDMFVPLSVSCHVLLLMQHAGLQAVAQIMQEC